MRIGVKGVVHEVLRLQASAVVRQTQEGVDTDQARNRLYAGRLRFVVLEERLRVAGELDLRLSVNRRHNVVVVGVEPLLHRKRLDIALRPLISVRHSEVGLQIAEVQLFVSVRNDTEQKCGVE